MILPSAYERRKEPEKVRAALIAAAAQLVAEHGLSRLTVDAVAKAAGVTKGGLFHHFPTKNELVAGVLGAMIDSADQAIDAAMASDPEPHGRFTRAYIANVFAERPPCDQSASRTLCLAMLADPQLLGFWMSWVEQRVARHADTDDNPSCALARLAADGIWLNSLRDPDVPSRLSPELRVMLTALTRRSP